MTHDPPASLILQGANECGVNHPPELGLRAPPVERPEGKRTLQRLRRLSSRAGRRIFTYRRRPPLLLEWSWVLNTPRLRNHARGRKRPTERRPEDWIRVPVPHLHIVSDALWTAAHERLDTSRRSYLLGAEGRLWGKPANGVESKSKYLLTGMAVCGMCGGAHDGVVDPQAHCHADRDAVWRPL